MPPVKELLRSVRNLTIFVEMAQTTGGLNSVANLIDNYLDSPQMQDCIRRFKALPGGAELMAARFPPLNPDLPALSRCPPGSLGQAYAASLQALHYDADFFRPRPIETEAQWLTQRIATTHDIHHVVAGFNTGPAGESGVLAITAAQSGFPGYVAINLVASFAAFRFKLPQYEGISRSIAHGHAIAIEAAPLAVQRWEDHWDRPLSEWRRCLDLHHPADGQPYGSDASPAP